MEWIEKVEEARERPADCSSVVGVDRPYDWRRVEALALKPSGRTYGGLI